MRISKLLNTTQIHRLRARDSYLSFPLPYVDSVVQRGEGGIGQTDDEIVEEPQVELNTNERHEIYGISYITALFPTKSNKCAPLSPVRETPC